jgi:hypothetical protein
MDAMTPPGSQTADTHSHLVRPESMEWQKTRFPGCEAKTLLFDRATGLMTALDAVCAGCGAARPRARQHRADLRARGQPGRQGRPGAGHRVQRPANSSGASRAAATSPGARRAADAGDLPGPQQVLRSRRPRRRCRGPGLGRDLGSYRQTLIRSAHCRVLHARSARNPVATGCRLVSKPAQ